MDAILFLANMILLDSCIFVFTSVLFFVFLSPLCVCVASDWPCVCHHMCSLHVSKAGWDAIHEACDRLSNGDAAKFFDVHLGAAANGGALSQVECTTSSWKRLVTRVCVFADAALKSRYCYSFFSLLHFGCKTIRQFFITSLPSPFFFVLFSSPPLSSCTGGL